MQITKDHIQLMKCWKMIGSWSYMISTWLLTYNSHDLMAMRFGTCHPKVWHLGILNLLSWRNLRNSRSRKDSLTSIFSAEVGHKTLTWQVPSLYQEERSLLIVEERVKGIWMTGLAKCSPVYYFSSFHLVLPCSPRTPHSSSNLI